MQVLKLPKSGKAMEEGTVTEWRFDEGDQVSEGDAVVIIESDKSEVEVTAEQDGVLLDIRVEAGNTVPVGTELGRVGSPEEATDGDETTDVVEHDGTATDPTERGDELLDVATRTDSAAADGPVRATPTARRIARERGVSIEAVLTNAEEGVSVRPEHVKAYDRSADTSETEILGSPYARVVANDHGVSIEEVGETFGTNRVREADVERYVEEHEVAASNVVGADADDERTPSVESTVSADESAASERAVREDRPLTGAAGVMYDRMGTVAREYASTTTVQRVDVTALLDLYERLAPAWEKQGDSLSLTAFVVRAVARTLPDYAELNAAITDEEMLRIYEDVNIGIAVDSDRGLVVPTIFDADGRSVRELSAEIDRLAGKARSGSLGPDEMQDGTFTVSNAGSLGAYMNTPQINPPQTAILGICKVFDEPGIVDGELVSRKKMHLCLTYDHRVIDGATAVGFVSQVADLLEAPESLLS